MRYYDTEEDKNFSFINERYTDSYNSHATYIIEAFNNPKTKIIVMGDFNDNKYEITKRKPLSFKIKKKKLTLKHNKTKKELKESLKSCCWHEKGHQWDYFDSPGDYILTNDQVQQISMYIPKYFNKKNRINNMFSDHKPVLSEIQIE